MRPGLRLALFLPLLLGACAAEPMRPTERLLDPGTPVLRPLTAVHSVGFTPGESGIGGAEARRLDAFLAESGVVSGHRVAVETPAAGDGLGARRAATLAAVLSGRGLQVVAGPEAPPLDAAAGVPSSDGGALRVYVERSVAMAPGCPDWSMDPNHSWQNQPSANHGCATAVNLAAMLARPADLAAGRDPGPAMAPAERKRPPQTQSANPFAKAVVETMGVGGE